jgi:PAS domain S-box-containing protein
MADFERDPEFGDIVELVRETLRAPVALLYVAREGTPRLVALRGGDTPEGGDAHGHFKAPPEPCLRALAAGKPVALEDAGDDAPPGTRGWLAAPFGGGDAPVSGVLAAAHPEPRSWSDDELALIQRLARTAGQRAGLLFRLGVLEERDAAVQRRRARLQELVDEADDAVAILDRSGRIRSRSSAFNQLLGPEVHPEKGLSGPEFWSRIDAVDLPVIRTRFREAIRHPNRPIRVLFRYDRGDGQLRRIAATGVNLLDDPAVKGVLLNLREVDLQFQPVKGTEQQRRLEVIGQLTAGIAHDFNNLLSVVLANAELLRESLPPDAREAAQDLEDLRAAARGGAELVWGLIALGRADELDVRPVDLGEVAQESVRMFRRILPSAIEVTCQVEPGIPSARVDRGAVEQVLLSLATNARDAMRTGGSLTVRVGPGQLGEEDPGGAGAETGPRARFRPPMDRPERSGPALRVEVEDTGEGMSEDVMSKAFEPFFSTRTPGRGAGLGLAMALQIVERHGGRIELESAPGEGTRVVLLLPAADGADPERPVRSLAELPGGSETILLVEDEEALRRTAHRVLRRMGYRVVEALDGRAALDYFELHGGGVDLVFSDVDMPRLSGIGLLDELRASGSRVPVLLTTGYTVRSLFPAGPLPDGVRLLPKPWSLEEMIRLVRDMLDGVRAAE